MIPAAERESARFWAFLRDFFNLPAPAPAKKIVVPKFKGRTAEEVREHCQRALDAIGSTPLHGGDAFKGQVYQMVAVLAREVENLRG